MMVLWLKKISCSPWLSTCFLLLFFSLCILAAFYWLFFFFFSLTHSLSLIPQQWMSEKYILELNILRHVHSIRQLLFILITHIFLVYSFVSSTPHNTIYKWSVKKRVRERETIRDDGDIELCDVFFSSFSRKNNKKILNSSDLKLRLLLHKSSSAAKLDKRRRMKIKMEQKLDDDDDLRSNFAKFIYYTVYI